MPGTGGIPDIIAVDPSFGGVGGGQVALSDILGNEQFYISITNDSERFGNFWDGFEGGITCLGAYKTEDAVQPTLIASVVRYSNHLLKAGGETQIIMTVPQD